MNSYSALL